MIDSVCNFLNDSPDFKKSLQVVHLTDCHSQQNGGLKKRPQNNAGVGILIN